MFIRLYKREKKIQRKNEIIEFKKFKIYYVINIFFNLDTSMLK